MTQYEIYEHLLSEKNMTSYQISQKTGISSQALSAWKKRNTNTSATNLQKIADVLCVDVSVFTKPSYTPTTNQETADNNEISAELKEIYSLLPDSSPEVQRMMLAMLRETKKKYDEK